MLKITSDNQSHSSDPLSQHCVSQLSTQHNNFMTAEPKHLHNTGAWNWSKTSCWPNLSCSTSTAQVIC